MQNRWLFMLTLKTPGNCERRIYGLFWRDRKGQQIFQKHGEGNKV